MRGPRYCQGDEMLKNFAAEPHLDKENKDLVVPLLALFEKVDFLGLP